MKYKVLFLIIGIIIRVQIVQGENVILNERNDNSLQLRNNTFTKFIVQHSLSKISTFQVNTPFGIFSELFIPDYSYSQEAGSPKLPVMRRLIEIPSGAEVTVVVTASHFTELKLGDSGLSQIIPAQPPQVKDNKSPGKFYYNKAMYQQNNFSPEQLVSIDVMGYLRGLRIGRLNISPIQYNPFTGKIRCYDELTIEISFIHTDLQLTRINKSRNLNPFFNTLNQILLNSLPMDAPLDTIVQYPVKFVIVSNPMFQSTLQPFVQWKKKKGFTVVEAYTNNAAVGNTTTSIKAYLQGLYDAGTSSDPPPSFVLFVGDVAQCPTFSGTLGSHPTDLYYCEYTGDYLPDAYYGRFSAITTTQLETEINKSLEYEQYTMPDPSFLNHCVMIAGMDDTYGPTYANGQINYGTSTYFNLAHGLTSHTYLYPASGSQYAQIIQDVSNGCCFANYTAHGNSAGWADPAFTTANVPSLSNSHKYPLMLGNACLTNKFDDVECFGEALIRASNKGALAYIGASDNTYWDEDFWWSVGAKPVSVNPTYSSTALGAYDRTFHDHGENYSQWFMTQGQMVFAGNLAVAQGSPANTNYYWEIYHLLGDPSLMVYYSQPPALTVSYSPFLSLGITNFTITTSPYAYAAISQAGVLHGAAQADTNGIANISIIPFNSTGTADVVVTKQNFQPFTGTVTLATPNAPLCLYTAHSINDSNGNNNGQVDYGENILLSLSLHNFGLQNATNITATLSSSDTNVSITDNSEFFDTVMSGNTVTIANAYAITMAGNVPDNHSILFLVTITDGINTWTGNFSVLAHSPVLTYNDYSISDPSGNQNSKLDPGETDDLIISFQNTGSSPAANTNCTLSASSGFVTINNPVQLITNLNAGALAQQTFSVSLNPGTPLGTLVTFNIVLSVNNGITVTASFTAIIGQASVLVLNLDGNNTAALPIQAAILANNINASIETSFPSNLNVYSTVFICLGMYNNNHVLTNAEGTALANYLNNGGKLYMEGGDTWYYNPPTPVHAKFKITGLSDGTADLDTLNGQSETLTEGMHFSYSGENSWVDRITPAAGSSAFALLKNTSPVYTTAVAYNGGNYRTIGASHEFAGLTNGVSPSTRNMLMRKYLEFFGMISTEVVAGFTASPSVITQGNTVSFTDTSTNTPVSWNWIFPGGTPSTSTLQNPVISYNTPGIFPVSLMATNANGSNTLVKNNCITVNPAAITTVSLGSYTGCSSALKIAVMVSNVSDAASISTMLNYDPSALTYTGITELNPMLLDGIILMNQNGSTIFFSWLSLSPLNIASDTLFILNFLPLTTGTFYLNWNTSAPDNCEFGDIFGAAIPGNFIDGQLTITSSGTPASCVIAASPSTSLCSGSPVTFTAYPGNSGANPLYQWKLNGIDVASGLTYTSSSLSDNDLITCQMTSSASCAGNNPATSNALQMNVFSTPLLELGNDTIVPYGQTIVLSAGSGFTSYLWSTGDITPTITVGVSGTYKVTVSTSGGCVAEDSIHIIILSVNAITGTLTYSNTLQTPLGNTLVKLYSGNIFITQTYTAGDGSFTFSPVTPGIYQIRTTCTIPSGGFNATDALLTMKHFVGMSYLSGLPLKAADVDASNTVNALDAMTIQMRTVVLIDYFPAGDWVFSHPTISFTGLQPVTVQLKGLCVGDVNGSYLPPSFAVAGEGLWVKGEETIQSDIFIIPIRIENSAKLGAISLNLGIPADIIDILDVKGPDNNVIWNYQDGILFISWYNVDGKSFGASDLLFSLKAKLKSTEGKEISGKFRMLTGSEFADSQAGILSGIKLSLPDLQLPYAGISAHIIPNPFSDNCSIQVNLAKACRTETRITDITGRLVAIVCDEDLPEGTTILNWNGMNQQGAFSKEGVYYLQINAGGEKLTKALVKIQ